VRRGRISRPILLASRYSLRSRQHLGISQRAASAPGSAGGPPAPPIDVGPDRLIPPVWRVAREFRDSPGDTRDPLRQASFQNFCISASRRFEARLPRRYSLLLPATRYSHVIISAFRNAAPRAATRYRPCIPRGENRPILFIKKTEVLTKTGKTRPISMVFGQGEPTFLRFAAGFPAMFRPREPIWPDGATDFRGARAGAAADAACVYHDFRLSSGVRRVGWRPVVSSGVQFCPIGVQ